jgi:hypothetical protein
MIFAYFGPDNILPLTSIIATVVGFFMMFGRKSFLFLGSFLTFNRKKSTRRQVVARPHSRSQAAPQSTSETAV